MFPVPALMSVTTCGPTAVIGRLVTVTSTVSVKVVPLSFFKVTVMVAVPTPTPATPSPVQTATAVFEEVAVSLPELIRLIWLVAGSMSRLRVLLSSASTYQAACISSLLLMDMLVKFCSWDGFEDVSLEGEEVPGSVLDGVLLSLVLVGVQAARPSASNAVKATTLFFMFPPCLPFFLLPSLDESVVVDIPQNSVVGHLF